MEKAIVEKLKLMNYPNKAIINRPNKTYLAELTDAQIGVPSRSVDLLFVFVETMPEFKDIVTTVIEKQLLNLNGALFVAYPKKGNKVYPTFVHRDEIFPALQVDEQNGYVGSSTLKFNRMVRLDAIFTVVGMKNVDRQSKSRVVSNSRVDDYVQFIPKVEKIIESNKEANALFKKLSPGYKKEWARYIYSAKQVATQEKRKKEMIDILGKGFKSKELYRQYLAK